MKNTGVITDVAAARAKLATAILKDHDLRETYKATIAVAMLDAIGAVYPGWEVPAGVSPNFATIANDGAERFLNHFCADGVELHPRGEFEDGINLTSFTNLGFWDRVRAVFSKKVTCTTHTKTINVIYGPETTETTFNIVPFWRGWFRDKRGQGQHGHLDAPAPVAIGNPWPPPPPNMITDGETDWVAIAQTEIERHGPVSAAECREANAAAGLTGDMVKTREDDGEGERHYMDSVMVTRVDAKKILEGIFSTDPAQTRVVTVNIADIVRAIMGMLKDDGIPLFNEFFDYGDVIEIGPKGRPVVHRVTDLGIDNFVEMVVQALDYYDGAPIDIGGLFCPLCGTAHVDAPEPDGDWTNPPHRKHLCHGCGFLWRPSKHNTNGVTWVDGDEELRAIQITLLAVPFKANRVSLDSKVAAVVSDRNHFYRLLQTIKGSLEIDASYQTLPEIPGNPKILLENAKDALKRNDMLGFDDLTTCISSIVNEPTDNGDWSTKWEVDSDEDRDAITAYVTWAQAQLTKHRLEQRRDEILRSTREMLATAFDLIAESPAPSKELARPPDVRIGRQLINRNMIRKQFDIAIENMKCMSETEADLHVVAPTTGSYPVIDEGNFLTISGEHVDAGITEKTFEEFFANQISREVPNNGKWMHLKTLFRDYLTGYETVRICSGPGSDNPKRVWILGLDPNGYAIGVRSEIVQTS